VRGWEPPQPKQMWGNLQSVLTQLTLLYQSQVTFPGCEVVLVLAPLPRPLPEGHNGCPYHFEREACGTVSSAQCSREPKDGALWPLLEVDEFEVPQPLPHAPLPLPDIYCYTFRCKQFNSYLAGAKMCDRMRSWRRIGRWLLLFTQHTNFRFLQPPHPHPMSAAHSCCYG
jgi:hypothetical protein